MAIQFARVQYISRSSGGNACLKAAYNERTSIKCERTNQVFNFKSKSDLSYHKVLLPKGVSEKFKDSSYLWNTAENAEKRKDSQVARESVIALPDNKEISHEDRIEIAKRYADAMFVSKGLAAQINIHSPHDGEKNWHAHVLATTRGFSADGLSLSPYKARDTDPIIKKGYIQKEVTPGELYAQIQNEFFKEKGLDLRVDPTGLVNQIHIGPVRMRKHMGDALERANLLREANEEAIRNPRDIFQKLTEKQSVFTEQDLNRLLGKHLDKEDIADVKNKVMSSSDLVRLHDKETSNETAYWTTRAVRAEEEKLLRFAHAVNEKGAKSIDVAYADRTIEASSLTSEQSQAVKFAIDPSKGFAIVEGRAGTGKSYTMGYIREIYENSDCRVIGLAPTNQVVQDMAKDGFKESLTVHSFLFKAKNGRMPIDRNTVLIVDEAAMLGNSAMVELLNCAKNNGLKVVLFGDDRQLSSVERGGMFPELISTFGSKELTEVRRQSGWHKQVSELLSNSQTRQAANLLQENGAIRLSANKHESLKQLVEDWAMDSKRDPQQERLILASRNVDVDTLNKAIRDIRLERGEISPIGYSCPTARGRETFAVNDRICLTITDKDLGLYNGSFGTIKTLDEKNCTIELDGGKKASFDPSKYHGLKLGYAATVYKSQGKSIPDIYSLHDPQASNKLNYVALTRHKESLKVYVNHDETKSLDHFASQLSRIRDKVSSLQFLTADEVAASRNIPEGFIGEVKKVWQDATKATKEFFSDTFHNNKDFYKLPDSKPNKNHRNIPVEKVHELVEQTNSSALDKIPPQHDATTDKIQKIITANPGYTIETNPEIITRIHDTFSGIKEKVAGSPVKMDDREELHLLKQCVHATLYSLHSREIFHEEAHPLKQRLIAEKTAWIQAIKMEKTDSLKIMMPQMSMERTATLYENWDRTVAKAAANLEKAHPNMDQTIKSTFAEETIRLMNLLPSQKPYVKVLMAEKISYIKPNESALREGAEALLASSEGKQKDTLETAKTALLKEYIATPDKNNSLNIPPLIKKINLEAKQEQQRMATIEEKALQLQQQRQLDNQKTI